MNSKDYLQHLYMGGYSEDELVELVMNNNKAFKNKNEVKEMIKRIINGVSPINVNQSVMDKIQSYGLTEHSFEAIQKGLGKRITPEEKDQYQPIVGAARARVVNRNFDVIRRAIPVNNLNELRSQDNMWSRGRKALQNYTPDDLIETGISHHLISQSKLSMIKPGQYALGGMINKLKNLFSSKIYYDLDSKSLILKSQQESVNKLKLAKTSAITKGYNKSKNEEIYNIFKDTFIKDLEERFKPGYKIKYKTTGQPLFKQYVDTFLKGMPEDWKRALATISTERNQPFQITDKADFPEKGWLGSYSNSNLGIFLDPYRSFETGRNMSDTFRHELSHAMYFNSPQKNISSSIEKLRNMGLEVNEEDYWTQPHELFAKAIGYRGKFALGGFLNKLKSGGTPIKVSAHEALTKSWNKDLDKLNKAGRDGKVSSNEIRGVNFKNIYSNLEGMFSGNLSDSKKDNITIGSNGIGGVLNGVSTQFLQNNNTNIPTIPRFSDGGSINYAKGGELPKSIATLTDTMYTPNLTYDNLIDLVISSPRYKAILDKNSRIHGTSGTFTGTTEITSQKDTLYRQQLAEYVKLNVELGKFKLAISQDNAAVQQHTSTVKQTNLVQDKAAEYAKLHGQLTGISLENLRKEVPTHQYRGEILYNNTDFHEKINNISTSQNKLVQSLQMKGGVLTPIDSRFLTTEEKFTMAFSKLSDRIFKFGGRMMTNIYEPSERKYNVSAGLKLDIGGEFDTIKSASEEFQNQFSGGLSGLSTDMLNTFKKNRRLFKTLEDTIANEISTVTQGRISVKEARTMFELEKRKSYEERPITVKGTPGTPTENMIIPVTNQKGEQLRQTVEVGTVHIVAGAKESQLAKGKWNEDEFKVWIEKIISDTIKSNRSVSQAGPITSSEETVRTPGIMTSTPTRISNMARGMSWKAASLSMASMGVFFSIQGVVMSIRQGIASITQPLTDIESLMKSIGMSNAFGAGLFNAKTIMDDMKITTKDMIEGWKSLTYFTSTLQTGFAALGTKIFGDKNFMDELLKTSSEFFKQLSSPTSIKTFQELFRSIAKAVPEIVSGIKMMVDMLKVIGDNPVIVKFAAQLMMVSMIIQPITSGFSALFTVFGGFVATTNLVYQFSKSLLVAAGAANTAKLSLGSLALTLGLVYEALADIMNVMGASKSIFGGNLPSFVNNIVYGQGDVVTGMITGNKGYAEGTTSVPGSGSGDTVPAMLTPGEAVIPEDHVKNNKALINALVKGTPVEHHELGTSVVGAGSGVTLLPSSVANQSDTNYYGRKTVDTLQSNADYNKVTSDVLYNSRESDGIGVYIRNWQEASANTTGNNNITSNFPFDIGTPTPNQLMRVKSDFMRDVFKTEVRTETKPEVKLEPKAEVKPEVKSELKTEVRPENKAEVKPESKFDWSRIISDNKLVAPPEEKMGLKDTFMKYVEDIKDKIVSATKFDVGANIPTTPLLDKLFGKGLGSEIGGVKGGIKAFFGGTTSGWNPLKESVIPDFLDIIATGASGSRYGTGSPEQVSEGLSQLVGGGMTAAGLGGMSYGGELLKKYGGKASKAGFNRLGGILDVLGGGLAKGSQLITRGMSSAVMYGTIPLTSMESGSALSQYLGGESAQNVTMKGSPYNILTGDAGYAFGGRSISNLESKYGAPTTKAGLQNISSLYDILSMINPIMSMPSQTIQNPLVRGGMGYAATGAENIPIFGEWLKDLIATTKESGGPTSGKSMVGGALTLGGAAQYTNEALSGIAPILQMITNPTSMVAGLGGAAISNAINPSESQQQTNTTDNLVSEFQNSLTNLIQSITGSNKTLQESGIATTTSNLTNLTTPAAETAEPQTQTIQQNITAPITMDVQISDINAIAATIGNSITQVLPSLIQQQVMNLFGRGG